MASLSRDRLSRSARAAFVRRAARRAIVAKLAVPVGAAVAFALLVTLLVVSVLISPGPPPGGSCGSNGTLELNAKGIPKTLIPYYENAAAKHRLGPRGPAVLAAINRIETNFGRLDAPGVRSGTNFAGAAGPMQFLLSTWRAYGDDGDGDGKKDVYNPADAIFGAANYLRASGAPRDWYRAVFAYNHADWYVRDVLDHARRYGDSVSTGDAAMGGAAPSCETTTEIGAIKRVCGGGRFVAVPGFPGEKIDRRLLDNIAFLKAHYRIHLADGFALSGHAIDGEHPIGAAADIWPGKGGTWDDIDRLARWAEPRQNAPRPPFRWVGYDGDANHGRGHHLHLSWDHSEPHTPGEPVRCIEVFTTRNG